jgi:hypothetical protein
MYTSSSKSIICSRLHYGYTVRNFWRVGQCNAVDACDFADYSEQFSKVGMKLIESKVNCFLSILSFKRANAVRLAQDMSCSSLVPKEREVARLSEVQPVNKHDNKSLTCTAARKQLRCI